MADKEDPCLPEQFGDPDVTGIGVLISFGVSTLLTIAVILVAYFTRGLRPDRYNAVDDFFLTNLFDFLGKSRGSHGEVIVAERIDAFEIFIQAMADQQLFTGLSLIVAIYLIRYGVTGLDADISAYSFCIAVNLALLSCVIHLSAMTVLRSRFTELRRLRNTRAIMMVVAIALLIPQLVISQIMPSDYTLRCALDLFDGNPTLKWHDHIYNQTIFFATLDIIGFITCGYLRRLLELYFPMFRISPDSWVAKTSTEVFGWPTEQAREDFNAQAKYHQANLASEITDDNKWHSKGGKAAQYNFVFRAVVSELSRSFLAEIIWLLFYTTFGVVQVIYFIIWGGASGKDTAISFTLGFGQILPLVLLALPFLSALELYSGLKRQKAEAARNGRISNTNCENGISGQSQLTPLPERSDVGSNLELLRPLHHEVVQEDTCLYKICLKQRRKITALTTWLTVVVYATVVICAAVAFTGIMWSGDPEVKNTTMIVGYAITLVFFVVSFLLFMSSTVGVVSWIWKRRYRRPFKLRNSEEVELHERL